MTHHLFAEDTLPALLSADGRRDRSTLRVEEALLPLFGLSIGEQLRFAAVVDEYVGAAFDEPETAVGRERRLRADALDEMRAAARHHKLPDGTGLTGDQYEQARAALDLTLTRRDITNAFERWSRANDVFTGRANHQTSRQRELQRRAQICRSRIAIESRHISCVQRWLADPTRPARTGEDYNAYARAHNETEPDPRQHLVLKASFTTQWGVFFADFVAFVRGDITIEEARARRAAELNNQGDCDLMLRDHVLARLDCTAPQLKHYVASGRFLMPSVRFNRSRVAWLREDVDTYLEGKELPVRDPVELRRRYLTRLEVAQQFGVATDTVTDWLYRRRWDKVPKPDACFAYFSYWKRTDVDAWLVARRSKLPPCS